MKDKIRDIVSSIKVYLKSDDFKLDIKIIGISMLITLISVPIFVGLVVLLANVIFSGV